jgi:hypothetical protein
MRYVYLWLSLFKMRQLLHSSLERGRKQSRPHWEERKHDDDDDINVSLLTTFWTHKSHVVTYNQYDVFVVEMH